MPPQWFAMGAQRHMAVYGSTNEDLGAIAIQERAHASKNPHAIARDPIDLDDYLNGRWVCEPFRVFDCCYEVDGAVALVLTSAERAKDLKHKPVYPLGVADGSGCGGVPEYWDDLTTMYSRDCAPRLWDRTGLRPSDMDVALMYDCFTFTVMATFEDFGFCAKGRGRATSSAKVGPPTAGTWSSTRTAGFSPRATSTASTITSRPFCSCAARPATGRCPTPSWRWSPPAPALTDVLWSTGRSRRECRRRRDGQPA